MNELQGELHQLEAWEHLPAGGGDNSASLQDELGQAHAGLPEAGLALWEGEGRPLEAVADALAGKLHHALFQGPQGEEGLLLVLLGGKPRELLLGADAPQQGGRECAGGLGVHPHRGQAEDTAHQPPAVAEAVLHRAAGEIGLARGCAPLGQGGKLQAVLPL